MYLSSVIKCLFKFFAPLFFSNWVVKTHLFESQREKEGKKDLRSAGALSRSPQQPWLGQTEARNFILGSRVGGSGPSTCVIIHCLPGCINRKLDWKWSSWHSDARCWLGKWQLKLLCRDTTLFLFFLDLFVFLLPWLCLDDNKCWKVCSVCPPHFFFTVILTVLGSLNSHTTFTLLQSTCQFLPKKKKKPWDFWLGFCWLCSPIKGKLTS